MNNLKSVIWFFFEKQNRIALVPLALILIILVTGWDIEEYHVHTGDGYDVYNYVEFLTFDFQPYKVGSLTLRERVEQKMESGELLLSHDYDTSYDVIDGKIQWDNPQPLKNNYTQKPDRE